MSKNIIIIGAGPAGLTAAYQLLKKTSLKPVILESSDYIGGISRTNLYKTNRMDLGGHRFFTKNAQVMELWQELMPLQGKLAKDDLLLGRQVELSENGPDPEQEERVFLRRRRVSRIYFLKRFFDYPISLKLQTFVNMGLLRTMKAGFGYLGSIIRKREENSLEDFYINRFGKPLYEMFFEDYTEKLWGVHPSKIAPDWGAQRVKGLSLFELFKSIIIKPFCKSRQVETSLIEEFYYPKKGPGQLWEAMAEEIVKLGGQIIKRSEVQGIHLADGRVTKVTVKTSAGERNEYESDTVFSSMPIKDLVAAMGKEVPLEVSKIAAELPYRDFITVGLLLNKLAIKNNSEYVTVSDIVPDCWIYIQERNVKLGRLQIFNNWSPYMVNDLENTVWIGLEYFCTEGDSMWTMPQEEFIKFAISELCKIGIINKEDVLDATMVSVKKAYPAYFGGYSQFDKVKNYLNIIENLYCIGRNGQHRYNNMDHSMLTAIEAVNAYCNGGNDKRLIWDVNTEEEYHETSSGER